MLKEKVSIAVGTPNRLCKLTEMGALSLTHTDIVMIDVKRDAKNFNTLTLPDVRNDLYSFLRRYCMSELDHLKLTLFA